MTASETVTATPESVAPPAERKLSIPGAYLRATATNSPAAREVRPDYESRVFFYCAFEAVVRRCFRATCPVSEIVRSVVNAGRRHEPVVVPLLEAEMLVRDALGETVPVEDIRPATIVTTHVLLFASLVDELALTDDELDAVIVEAEDRATELGHAPERPAGG
jgi:hypothetical protein